MSLVTNVMAVPLLLWLSRGTELEPFVRRSGFLGRKAEIASTPDDGRSQDFTLSAVSSAANANSDGDAQ
jgi:hypothetical protein